jgi:DNA-binding response OmpR family regulator
MQNKNKILLVEDELIISRVHRQFLEKMGFAVAWACSGKQTLKMYTENFIISLSWTANCLK